MCRKAEDFKCRSFSYNAAKRMCVLNELNVGLSGKLTFDTQWDYYELRDETKVCSDRLKCANGKCLKDVELCDGKVRSLTVTAHRICNILPHLRTIVVTTLMKTIVKPNQTLKCASLVAQEVPRAQSRSKRSTTILVAFATMALA